MVTLWRRKSSNDMQLYKFAYIFFVAPTKRFDHEKHQNTKIIAVGVSPPSDLRTIFHLN